MSTLEQAARQALEALEKIGLRGWVERKEEAITVIREALAEQKLAEPCPCGKQTTGWCFANTCSKAEQPAQQQEPLPCPFCGHKGLDFDEGSTYRWGVASCSGCGASCGEIRREYPDQGQWHTEAIAEWNRRTSPQPSKPWVGLTQQDIDIAFDDTQEGGGFNEFARAIETKLREKNTGEAK